MIVINISLILQDSYRIENYIPRGCGCERLLKRAKDPAPQPQLLSQLIGVNTGCRRGCHVEFFLVKICHIFNDVV